MTTNPALSLGERLAAGGQAADYYSAMRDEQPVVDRDRATSVAVLRAGDPIGQER